MSTFYTLSVVALATHAACDAWLYGSIFASWRLQISTWRGLAILRAIERQENEPSRRPGLFFLLGIAEGLGCEMCLTYHIPYLLLGLSAVPMIGMFVVQSLAATGLVLLTRSVMRNRN